MRLPGRCGPRGNRFPPAGQTGGPMALFRSRKQATEEEDLGVPHSGGGEDNDSSWFRPRQNGFYRGGPDTLRYLRFQPTGKVYLAASDIDAEQRRTRTAQPRSDRSGSTPAQVGSWFSAPFERPIVFTALDADETRISLRGSPPPRSAKPASTATTSSSTASRAFPIQLSRAGTVGAPSVAPSLDSTPSAGRLTRRQARLLERSTSESADTRTDSGGRGRHMCCRPLPAVDVHQHLWPPALLDALRARSAPPFLRGWTLSPRG